MALCTHTSSYDSNYSKFPTLKTAEISVNNRTLKFLIQLDRKSAKNSRVKVNDGSAKPRLVTCSFHHGMIH